MFQQAPAQERESVLRFVESIIVNAQRKAEMTIALLKNLGYKVQPKKGPVEISAGTVPRSPEADWLSNLGAALQIASWERSGIHERLPPGSVPPFSEALRQLSPARGDESAVDPEGPPPGLNRQVFRTWLENFSHTAPRELGVDVLLCQEDLSAEDLLTRLADFLWEHRGWANSHTAAH